MMQVLCEVKGCNLLFDSVSQLREHRLDNHFQHYFELANGNEKLLLRYMSVITKRQYKNL